MQRGLAIRVGFLVMAVVMTVGCGRDEPEFRSEVCAEDGRCWRVESYAATPSSSACVTGRVIPCDGQTCPPHRFLPERQPVCQPFGESGRSFCSSGLEAWLVPLRGATRWGRQKELEGTELCVENTWNWEYEACLIDPEAYAWQSCTREMRAGVALAWRIDDERVPPDRDFRVVVRSLVE